MRLLFTVHLLFVLQQMSYCQGASADSLSVEPLSQSHVPQNQAIATGDLLNILSQTANASVDPFVTIPKLVVLKDSAVTALATILGSDQGLSGVSENAKHKIRIYCLLALDGIGTERAFGALLTVSKSTTDVDLKAIALKSLGVTYYQNGYPQINTPDKEVVHAFLSSVDDTAIVDYYKRSIGEIAREGLINWTGKDLGSPQGIAAVAGNSTVSIREEWWQTSSSSMIWDSGTYRFNCP